MPTLLPPRVCALTVLSSAVLTALFLTGTPIRVFAQPSPPTEEILIAASPLASAERPAIDGATVIWYDDRAGPTDVWSYNLATEEYAPLTTHRDAQLIADLSADFVVYEDNRNGTWDIYATRRATGEEFPVARGPHHQRYPRVWGDYIVYQDETARYDESDVYLYQISTGRTTQLGASSGYQGQPDIDQGWVVWFERAQGQERLGIYQLATQQSNVYPIHCRRDCAPRLAGDEVVWSDWRSGDADIYRYNLATGQETPVFTAPGDQLLPVISDQLIAWQDADTYGNWDVFVQVRATGAIFPVTLAPSHQMHPAVAGDRVVWQDNRSHRWAIYGFHWQGTPPQLALPTLPNPRALTVGAFPEGQLRLTWQDHSSDEQGFIVQRAVGIFATDWQDYVTLPPNSQRYTDSATVSGESYWYRVRAFHAGGTSGYSNESYATAVGEDVPSPDERFLHVLINETRMAPGVWGYPQVTPLNPVGWDRRFAYAARSHALGMNNSDCCQGHTDLAGRGPGERAAASDYPYSAAENLFQGQSGPAGMGAIHQGFLDSAGHRANLLNPNTRQLAIGFAPGGRGTLVETFSSGPPGFAVPALPSGAVAPYTSTQETPFVYLVSFWNPDNAAPMQSQVLIDGTAYPMQLRSGEPWRGTYVYTTTLALGQHNYAFAFAWPAAGGAIQTARFPADGVIAGPYVRPHLPDVTISQLRTTALAVGQPAKITAEVLNQGELSADALQLRLYLGDPQRGGELLQSVDLTTPVQPQQRQLVAFTWQPASVGAALLTVWADPANQLAEGDESNNLFTKRVVVRESEITWFVDGTRSRAGNGRSPSQAFSAIQEALNVAYPGDLVFVAAGLYTETVSVPFGVHLRGAGFAQTTIRGPGSGSVLYANDGSSVSGFTITGSGDDYWDAGIWIKSDATATIYDNQVISNSMGIVQVCFEFDTVCTGASSIRHNLVRNQRYTGINSHRTAPQISNNTVIANGLGIHADVADTVVRNNMVVGNDGGVDGQPAVQIDHNNLWGNRVNLTKVTAGPGNVSVDPLFAAGDQEDFQVLPQSPTRRIGHPDALYLNIDGTRNDLGWFGGRAIFAQVTAGVVAASLPQADEHWQILYQATLDTGTAETKQLTVAAALPPGTRYVADSAASSHGSVQGIDELLFTVGDLPASSNITLTYRVATVTALTQTTVFSAPLQVTWRNGHRPMLTVAHVVVDAPVGNQRLFLPLVRS
jgi:beta propeller repeat protein